MYNTLVNMTRPRDAWRYLIDQRASFSETSNILANIMRNIPDGNIVQVLVWYGADIDRILNDTPLIFNTSHCDKAAEVFLRAGCKISKRIKKQCWGEKVGIFEYAANYCGPNNPLRTFEIDKKNAARCKLPPIEKLEFSKTMYFKFKLPNLLAASHRHPRVYVAVVRCAMLFPLETFSYYDDISDTHILDLFIPREYNQQLQIHCYFKGVCELKGSPICISATEPDSNANPLKRKRNACESKVEAYSVMENDPLIVTEKLWTHMLERSPRDFELFCADFCVAVLNMSEATVTGKTRDGGHDILWKKSNVLGIAECKKISSKVDVTLVRGLVGARQDLQVKTGKVVTGMKFFTTNEFTQDSVEFAKRNEILEFFGGQRMRSEIAYRCGKFINQLLSSGWLQQNWMQERE